MQMQHYVSDDIYVWAKTSGLAVGERLIVLAWSSFHAKT